MSKFADYYGLTYDDVQIVPARSGAKSRSDIDTITTLVGDIQIYHPLIPANMDTISSLEMVKTAWDNGSMCFFHRFGNINDLIQDVQSMIYHMNEWPIIAMGKTIGISVGTKYYDVENAKHVWYRIQALDPETKLIVLIDVAHGHHDDVVETIRNLRQTIPDVYIIAGNIATYTAAIDLIDAGAQGLKVGVGPGSLCSTRIETGAGVPQFTAVSNVRQAINDTNGDVTLIADGGVKYTGDIVKAIGAGANTVMSGYLFAGTDATPGEIEYNTWRGQTLEKVYRGSASRESKMDRGEKGNVEGVATRVPFKGFGSTKAVFNNTRDGIRSGLSYAGHEKLQSAVDHMLFVRITQASIFEASPNAAR